MEPRWTIGQLAELAERVLRELGCDRPVSGRVRAVPDERTIRYYTTLGLIDRPAEMRGRVAYYGPRHLLQLVAIKKLQSQGLPLVAIQERLAGISDAGLERLVGLPDGLWRRIRRSVPDSSGAGVSEPSSAERVSRLLKERLAFWKEAVATTSAGRPARQNYGAPAVDSRGGAARAVHLELEPGVRLVIEGAVSEQWLSNEVIGQLRTAARPLVEVIRRLRSLESAEET